MPRHCALVAQVHSTGRQRLGPGDNVLCAYPACAVDALYEADGESFRGCRSDHLGSVGCAGSSGCESMSLRAEPAEPCAVLVLWSVRSGCSPVLWRPISVANRTHCQPRLLAGVWICGGQVTASAVPASRGAHQACCAVTESCTAGATSSRSRHRRSSPRPAASTSAATAAYTVRMCCQPRWLTLRSMVAMLLDRRCCSRPVACSPELTLKQIAPPMSPRPSETAFQRRHLSRAITCCSRPVLHSSELNQSQHPLSVTVTPL